MPELQGEYANARFVSWRPQPVLAQGRAARILLLPCCRNILMLRSEGRTDEWAQAHFFVGTGWSALDTGLGRGVSA
jgi:hypothetical protein